MVENIGLMILRHRERSSDHFSGSEDIMSESMVEIGEIRSLARHVLFVFACIIVAQAGAGSDSKVALSSLNSIVTIVCGRDIRVSIFAYIDLWFINQLIGVGHHCS